ncbi:MAG: LysR family transcriptional regulator substrate-binding protein [Stomatobaculum sp.]
MKQANALAPHSQFFSIDIQATCAMIAAGLGVSLNNAILSCGLDLTRIVILPTQPLYEVEIGIVTPRKKDRSPAAEQFLRFAIDNLPDD